MKSILTILCLGVVMTSYAQEFEISTELRPRFEYRHGYKTLVADSSDAASFVSQRTRLNVGYKSEKLNAYVSLQNVRVWGDVSTLAISDENGTALHEAWAELLLTSKFSVKLGRQEIVYDDHRIFGNVGWAQQARSHDALIATYKPAKNHRLDIGLALNENEETLTEAAYTVPNYKSFQYVWYHTKVNDVGVSLLVLNNGLAFDDENNDQQVAYSQTLGTHVTYDKNKLNADASFYFQTGEIEETAISAYNMAFNGKYNLTETFTVGLGGEYLSGTAMDATNNTLKSFNPLYGTNHKFNGFMDYFYVGNHINSVGLVDVNGTVSYQKNKLFAKVMPHLFSAAATVLNNTGETLSKGLGTEVDVVLGYTWTNDVSFQAGYSQLFATETMEVLKGGDHTATNNWAWVMVTVKPSLFKTAFKKD